mgnify:FL=1
MVCLMLLALGSRAQVKDKLAYPDLRSTMWYRNVLIYNLEISVFKDSDGDGRGDIKGLVSKLDYLKSIGVDVIWLAPYFPSPGEDDGYDVADFYGIEPALGDHGLFNELVEQVKYRGMRLIIDLVINHTSDRHPWFRASSSSTDSPYRNWYIWREERPKDWNKGMVFPGVQEGVWSLDSTTKQYYYHRFYEFQPDLNFSHQEVTLEIQRIISFWLRQNIDGFRIDAVPFVIELPDSPPDKPELDFDFLYKLRQLTVRKNPEAVILGEANVPPEENTDYFGEKSQGLLMMFNFYVNQHLFFALATGDTRTLTKALQDTRDIPETAQWAHFLRNHDEIDLGRLTEQQRRQVYDRFGPDTSMQLYDRGIRRRLAPMLGDPDLIRLAYSVLFSLPGTPVIRYGEEIGMGDDLTLKERLSVRTPMQWDTSYQAGFSTGDSLWRPVISDGNYDYRQVNVEQQLKDTLSLLHHIGRLTSLRKTLPQIGEHNYEILEGLENGILGIRYRSLVVFHNFCDCPKQVRLKEPMTVSLVLGKEKGNEERVRVQTIDLQPYDYRWYRVE